MRTLFLSVLFLSVFTLTSAQKNNSFGIKGGLNFTNLFVEDVNDNNILVGLHAGLVAVFPIVDYVAIQSEILYSGKGAALEYNNAIVEGKAKFRLSYLEVPLLLRVNLTKIISIHAGMYAAYLINANIKNETSVGIFDLEKNLYTNDFKKFDYGLSGGVEIELLVLSIGARYNYGFANIGKERTIGGTVYTFPDAKNSTFNVYMALRF